MRVFEIFRSIQGETTRVGVPMDFVRLAGCDLACSYCDTPAARDAAAGRDMTVGEVVGSLARPALGWVMVTGGEPMLQAGEVNALIDALAEAGRRTVVETSGAHDIGALDERAVRVVDIKTPGSGMADRVCWSNLQRLTARDEVKFVLTDRADYEWARQVVATRRLAEKVPVLFGAALPHLDARNLANWVLEDGLAVRLNVQVHKFLGLP
ncbi:MAG TPA: radical SAM protein [Phycisphaerae bacterium]|nr:radical SAM protein [Phycisphaerae bacterium]